MYKISHVCMYICCESEKTNKKNQKKTMISKLRYHTKNDVSSYLETLTRISK